MNPLADARFLSTLALTVSNREEGLKLMNIVSLQVGISWALHLWGGGLNNLNVVKQGY